MDYEQWINLAISKTGLLKRGQDFTLKDLFDGIKWSELSNGEKRELGRQFKYKVSHNLIPYVEHIGNAQNGSALYKKTN